MTPTRQLMEKQNENHVTSSKINTIGDIPMEWVIGCSIGAGVLLIASIFAMVFIWKWVRKNKTVNNDKDATVRTLYYVTRYSSSDTSDSPLDAQLLEDTIKPNLSSYHVQPKTHSSYQRGLLSVSQPDVSGTSDEEEAHQVANTAGRIWFSLKFDSKLLKLTITVIKARYLRGRDMVHEPRDPFVRIYLLPDELHYQQSKARRRTLSPRFNESFTFTISEEELRKRTVKLSMYDIDKKNVRHSLGHALVPLEKVDLTSQSTIWRNLETISQKTNQIGELLFSLCCNPYTDRLKVSVLRGKNLAFKNIKLAQQTDLFFRIELYYGPKLIKCKETTKQKFCPNPNIFQNFSFCIGGKHFDSCSVAFVAMLAPEGNNDPKNAVACGRVVVGSFLFARREELQHWQDMMANPRTPTERWHHLTELT